MSDLRCAFCHDKIGAAVPCPRCKTVLHFDCWREARVCPSLGCGAPAPGKRRSFLALSLLSLGILVASGGFGYLAGTDVLPFAAVAHQGVFPFLMLRERCPTTRWRITVVTVIAGWLIAAMSVAVLATIANELLKEQDLVRRDAALTAVVVGLGVLEPVMVVVLGSSAAETAMRPRSDPEAGA